MQPIEFIERLREIYPERYTDGTNGCLKFHLMLKALYPHQCHGWYNSDHIISQIRGEYYDIDGIVEKTSDYLPMEDYGSEPFYQFTQTDRHEEIFAGWNGEIH